MAHYLLYACLIPFSLALLGVLTGYLIAMFTVTKKSVLARKKKQKRMPKNHNPYRDIDSDEVDDIDKTDDADIDERIDKALNPSNEDDESTDKVNILDKLKDEPISYSEIDECFDDVEENDYVKNKRSKEDNSYSMIQRKIADAAKNENSEAIVDNINDENFNDKEE